MSVWWLTYVEQYLPTVECERLDSFEVIARQPLSAMSCYGIHVIVVMLRDSSFRHGKLRKSTEIECLVHTVFTSWQPQTASGIEEGEHGYLPNSTTHTRCKRSSEP